MSNRILVHVDETKPLRPVVCLRIMGKDLMLSDAEVQELVTDLDWAKVSVSSVRRQYYANLPKEYCRA